MKMKAKEKLSSICWQSKAQFSYKGTTAGMAFAHCGSHMKNWLSFGFILLAMILVLTGVTPAFANDGDSGGSEGGGSGKNGQPLDEFLAQHRVQSALLQNLIDSALSGVDAKLPNFAKELKSVAADKYFVTVDSATLQGMVQQADQSARAQVQVVSYNCNSRVVSGVNSSAGTGGYIGLGVGSSISVSSGFNTACDHSTTVTENRDDYITLKHAAADAILAVQRGPMIYLSGDVLKNNNDAVFLIRHELIVGDALKRQLKITDVEKENILALNILLSDLNQNPRNISSADLSARIEKLGFGYWMTPEAMSLTNTNNLSSLVQKQQEFDFGQDYTLAYQKFAKQMVTVNAVSYGGYVAANFTDTYFGYRGQSCQVFSSDRFRIIGLDPNNEDSVIILVTGSEYLGVTANENYAKIEEDPLSAPKWPRLGDHCLYGATYARMSKSQIVGILNLYGNYPSIDQVILHYQQVQQAVDRYGRMSDSELAVRIEEMRRANASHPAPAVDRGSWGHWFLPSIFSH